MFEEKPKKGTMCSVPSFGSIPQEWSGVTMDQPLHLSSPLALEKQVPFLLFGSIKEMLFLLLPVGELARVITGFGVMDISNLQ